MTDMPDRQTGITTRQMQGAPKGSVFVWCNSSLHYPRSLARSIGREDLEVVPLYWLGLSNVVARRLTGLVLDHAAPMLSDGAYAALMYVRAAGVPESDTDGR